MGDTERDVEKVTQDIELPNEIENDKMSQSMKISRVNQENLNCSQPRSIASLVPSRKFFYLSRNLQPKMLKAKNLWLRRIKPHGVEKEPPRSRNWQALDNSQ
jgi:hypothetical protein